MANAMAPFFRSAAWKHRNELSGLAECVANGGTKSAGGDGSSARVGVYLLNQPSPDIRYHYGDIILDP